ncbi:UNVERIFIED_CONTAM: Photosynthetic NDH subunit of subcomplex B 4, chloroplastic [Sesamum radiatum]|uniref:Photosynthetic NDH subunit of subcomplex B 4, chloroplastic n=1 Tax=Sesamum radiatum TaxID=300843 RepID=A0AAW2WHA0_SESRA
MAETITTFTLLKPSIQTPNPLFSSFSKSIEDGKSRRASSVVKVKALPDWPLMAVMVEHMEGQRDLITHKSIWHLSDEAMKNVYTFYIMFTCWGCCFFGSTKDPYYDSEAYRKDGGDGTGHWVYEKQEDIEESARAELWREELIEEIEQKVGGLRELEEAGKKEEILK